MAKLTTLQPFRDIEHLKAHHRLLLSKPYDTWRLIKNPIMGQIQGLPTLNGFALATNGIIVLIQRVDIVLHNDFLKRGLELIQALFCQLCFEP